MSRYDDMPCGMAVTDPEWEHMDPTPDIRELFLTFNALFFESRLSAIEVKWSERMTLCAGVCSFDGQLCSVRLSSPLLSLRPRSDLINTLLHEMLHAYLFLTNGSQDRDGHGPDFLQLAERINFRSGSRITVYHTFRDEVDAHRVHWWKCDGPCQTRAPYFGVVKRATNRAPSQHDPWWADHQRMCGGTYGKIKEPPPRPPPPPKAVPRPASVLTIERAFENAKRRKAAASPVPSDKDCIVLDDDDKATPACVVQCPICAATVPLAEINSHIDESCVVAS